MSRLERLSLRKWITCLFAAALMVTAGTSLSLAAESVADFYRGKTIRMLISGPPELPWLIEASV